MFRNVLIGMTLSLLVLGHMAVGTAQTAPTDTVKIVKGGDLRPIVTAMRQRNELVQGRVKVSATPAQGGLPALTLYATVDKGQITKWEFVDGTGTTLPTTTSNATVSCEVCTIITNANGVRERYCRPVDCKDVAQVPSTKIQ